MAIKTNKINQSVVQRIRNLYDFPNESIPAKIALNISLQQNKVFDISAFEHLDNTGKEYSEDTLFGGRENYILYRALFNQQYSKLLNDSEFSKIVKIHLDWGLDKLREDLLETEKGRNAHIDYLISIIKRGTNLVADEKNFLKTASNAILAHSDSIASIENLIDFDLGTDEKGEVINIRLNDLKEYESHHIAIAGTTGSGKTELIKDILFQISQKTNHKMKFIFFDYKGEGQSEKLKPFLSHTKCEYINPLESSFEFNPLSFIHLSNEKYQNFHINSFVDAVAAIETKLGAKQKNLLKTIIGNSFEKKRKEGKHPTLKDIFVELERYYDELKEKPDSLYAVMQDLSAGIFAEDFISKKDKIYENSLYVSLPEAMSEKLRQLCVFLTLKYLLSEFTSMDDVEPNEDRINPLRYIIVIDEAHIYLNNKNARSILEQLLRVIRSKGVVVILLSQGPEDYYKPDFDFSSQIKIPLCLHIKSKNIKAIERFVGTARSSIKLQDVINKLDKGKGILNLSEPKLIELKQFWQRTP
jgi:DNA sulfur modification protein DndE